MGTISAYRNLIESGGCRMHYVLSISGYPYGIATSQEVIDALNDTDGGVLTNTAAAARRRIFGHCHFTVDSTEIYPADDVPIFPTLDFNSLGAQTWTVREDQGTIEGGDWSCDVLNVDLGHTWDHSPTGDEFRGLEGIHRVINLYNNTVVGWGHVTDDLPRKAGGSRPTTISVLEKSAGQLVSQIDGLGSGEYAVVWMGHEAIAVTAVDDSEAPILSLTIADNGEGRGLYRSRPQSHRVSSFSEANIILSSVPLAVDGAYAWLWAIPMTPSGEFYNVTGGAGNVLSDGDFELTGAGEWECYNWELCGGTNPKLTSGYQRSGDYCGSFVNKPDPGTEAFGIKNSVQLVAGVTYAVTGYAKVYDTDSYPSSPFTLRLGGSLYDVDVTAADGDTWYSFEVTGVCTDSATWGTNFYFLATTTDGEGDFIGLVDDLTITPESAMIVQEREGRIKPNAMRTKDSKTTIYVSSPWKVMEERIDTESYRNAHLAKYVLTRGDSGTEHGTDEYDVDYYLQSPHLVIWEYGGTGDYDVFSNWVANAIWLCEQNETVVFDTVEDLIAALNKELDYCSNNSSSQKSGDDTTGNSKIDLTYLYTIPSKGGFIQQFTGTYDYVDNSERSYLFGPLAFLLTLGVVNTQSVYDVEDIDQVIEDTRVYINKMRRGDNWFDYCNATMYTGDSYAITSSIALRVPRYNTYAELQNAQGFLGSLWQEPEFVEYEFIHERLMAKYILMYDWASPSTDIKNFKGPGNFMTVQNLPSSEWKVPTDPDYNDHLLWLMDDDAYLQFSSGDEITIGGTTYGRYKSLEGDVSSVGVDSGATDYPYIILDSGQLSINDPSSANKIKAGRTLYYMPLVDNPDGDEDFVDVDPAPISGNKIVDNPEPHKVFRKLFGSEDVLDITLSDAYTITWEPFFHSGSDEYDWGDFIPLIDWDSVDEELSPVISGHHYYTELYFDKLSVDEVIANEIVLHAASWERYFDDLHLVWRFRLKSMGMKNLSQVSITSNEINETMLIPNSYQYGHGLNQRYQKLVLSANYTNGEYLFIVEVEDKGSLVAQNNERGTLTIESKLSRFRIGSKKIDGTTSAIRTHLIEPLLRQLSLAYPTVQAKTTGVARFTATAGGTAFITSSFIRDPATFELGISSAPAYIIRSTFNIAKQLLTFDFELGRIETYGIAPAMRVQATNSTKDGWPSPGTITMEPDAHYFTSSKQPSDYCYFDCLYWPGSDISDSAAEERNCSCGDYAVLCFDRSGGNQTIISGTVSVDLTTVPPTVILTPDAQADYDAWNTSNEYIVVFDTWDNVESCQQKWLYHCDDAGTLGAGNDKGHRFVP